MILMEIDISHALYLGYVTNANNIKNMIIGENSSREAYSGCCYNTHAEMNAIGKLPPVYDNKKRKIYIVVIRIDKNGNLKNSAPCSKCVEHMLRLNGWGSYNLKDIYYSNEDGNIIKTSLKDLETNENNYVSSRFRTNKK